jgi:chromosome partitioning protein
VIPSPLSARMLVQLRDFLVANAWVDMTLLPFFSMVDRRKALHHELIARTRSQFPSMLKTEVPYWSEIERMTLRRSPLPAYAPRSEAAGIYAELWSEVEVKLKQAAFTRAVPISFAPPPPVESSPPAPPPSPEKSSS